MPKTLPLPIEAHATAAKSFVSYLNKCVTPFHAVAETASELRSLGYKELKEQEPWPALDPGSRYYVTRNASSIVAFAVGGRFAPGNGVKIVGAHTDSPNFALKPNVKSRRHGYASLGVQPYGGGLWHTWFDRDLTIAGRVLLQKADDGTAPIEARLVHIDRPILRIPNLAIHLTTAKEREAGFSPNKEAHLVPVLATMAALEEEVPVDGADDNGAKCPQLYGLLAEELNVAPKDILDFDLSVVDTQAAVIGGLKSEFVFGPRIDNLLSCYCGLEALKRTDGTLASESMVRVIAFFDHEEVGSGSAPGAAGTLIPDLLERLQQAQLEKRAQTVARSFCLSVDGSHGCHPNYSDRHEAVHRPLVHQGPVVKYNANQRYSTSGETAAVVQAIAKVANVPLQKVCVKNDSPCGSTIGPITTALSGMRGADLGNAMLSMHSVREMCGTVDVEYLSKLLSTFFEFDNFPKA